MLGVAAVPLFVLTQCTPNACAPPATPGMLRPGTVIPIGKMQTYGFAGHLGADWLDARERQIRKPGGGYWALRNFSRAGVVDGGGVPVEPTGVRMARLEFYPDLIPGHWGSYDAWSPQLTVGGIHLWNPDGRAMNHLRLPHASNGAVRYNGSVTVGGATPANGRMRVNMFQLVPKDTTVGAFNISSNRGTTWTAGWIWPGTYELFFYDDATGRSIYVRADLRPQTPLRLDLSKPCFGFATCTKLS
jgi:hypothetical protein